MDKRTGATCILILLLLGCIVLLKRNDAGNHENPFPISVIGGELLMSSREGFGSVTIYRMGDLLVINAESDAEFFDGAQFTVEPEGEIGPEDIEVIWTTLGGRIRREDEGAENHDFIIAEIKITENGELIFDTKVNFAKKAFEAIDEFLQRNE